MPNRLVVLAAALIYQTPISCKMGTPSGLYTLLGLAQTPPVPAGSQDSATTRRKPCPAPNFESRVLLGLDSSIAVIETIGKSVEAASNRIEEFKDIECKVERIGETLDGFRTSMILTICPILRSTMESKTYVEGRND
jgi:hypothetical protein